jgi:hypothetical protein
VVIIGMSSDGQHVRHQHAKYLYGMLIHIKSKKQRAAKSREALGIVAARASAISIGAVVDGAGADPDAKLCRVESYRPSAT